jgi:WD40 repeat protein
MAFSPNSRYLATAGGDKDVKVWDSESGQLLHTLHGYDHSGILTFDIMPWALSPDGRRFAWGQYFRNMDMPSDVKMLESADGDRVHSWRGHQQALRSLRFSPDGRYLATASGDRLVILWDPTTGKEVLTLRGHARSVWCLAFSPDGRRLASGGVDGTIRIWDVSPLD